MSKASHAGNIQDFRPRLKPIAAALLCAGYATFGHLPVYAQESAGASDQDTVTLGSIFVRGAPDQPGQLESPKFTAPLLDTPQTVQIIPRDIFSQQGAQNLTDVLRNTPGISFSAGENGFSTNNNNFSLRGFDTSGHIFIDGVRDSGNYRRDIFNVEQVEVAKGPAADNGRGGAGGYINIVTKRPSLDDTYSASIGYGFDEYDSGNRLRTALDLNQVVAPGTAARLNLLMQEGGVAGRELAQQTSIGVAPSLAFGLDSPTRVILSAQYLEQEDLPDWGVPAAFIKDMIRYDSATNKDDRDNFYGLASDYDDTKSHSLTARIEHDFSPNLGISNQTRWSEIQRDSRFTVPTGYNSVTQEVAAQTQFYDRENTSISNLTSLLTRFETGSLRHTAAIGLEFSRETSESLRIGAVNPPVTDIFNPDPHRFAGVPAVAPTQSSKVEIDTVAVYGYDTIEFSERWEVTGGLRGERYEVNIDSKTLPNDPQGPDGYKVSDSTISGKLGLVFKPRSEGSLYSAVGLSTLPPGSYLSNPDISRTGDNAFPGLVGQNNEEAKTQQAINYELGAKWNFYDDRLHTAVALFRTERRNVAITGADNPGDPVVLQGYGKQIVQGVELSASGEIRPGWSAYGGILFLDSERKHSALLDERRRNANPGDYANAELGTSALTTNGDELAFTPKVTASLWTTYGFSSGFTIGGGLQHVDDSWAGRPDDADRIIPNGIFGKLAGYTVLNAMAAYAVNPNLVLRLNIDNITDELYATSSNWPAQRVFLGAPRSYLLTADLTF